MRDRLSFRRFCGLPLEVETPDLRLDLAISPSDRQAWPVDEATWPRSNRQLDALGLRHQARHGSSTRHIIAGAVHGCPLTSAAASIRATRTRISHWPSRFNQRQLAPDLRPRLPPAALPPASSVRALNPGNIRRPLVTPRGRARPRPGSRSGRRRRHRCAPGPVQRRVWRPFVEHRLDRCVRQVPEIGVHRLAREQGDRFAIRPDRAVLSRPGVGHLGAREHARQRRLARFDPTPHPGSRGAHRSGDVKHPPLRVPTLA